MARQVMTGGAVWQGRMKQPTMQADANEKSALATHVLATFFFGDMVRVLSTRMQHNVAAK